MFRMPIVYPAEPIAWLLVSVTETTNGKVPPPEAKPEIVPVVGPSVKPGGKLPWLTDHW
jgi:hypothetical protein